MWFLTEARLPISRSLFDLWHRNESESSLGSLFCVPVGSARKTMQSFNCQFIDWLEKHDFLQMTSNMSMYIPLKSIFFSTSMNSRSLPQNKTLFGSDPLAKFVVFVQKYVPTIWALSSRIEGTILKNKLTWVDWHPIWPSKLARECCALPEPTVATVQVSHLAVWAAAKPATRVSVPFEPIPPTLARNQWPEPVDRARTELVSKKEKRWDLKKERERE